ncbi:dnaJ-like protein 60 isoform X2 [Hyposmocoma kahamanoa]|uniref:dnaJ-like protein 60 isoform X2 n=1 Tax=Hyposmocoma kahamanoa TaxID=1477025 RepID=UPI000E6DA4C3|nr:dnaJ-like protein 60 isoform X2 [Hyposmocoma kahamanoa]
MYNLVKRHPDLKIINVIVKCYSLSRKTHYEVLNLRRNCTDKEIKEAYIQMSKEFHPDKNKDKNAQQNFVRIVEAYNTLSKPASRAQYDSLTELNTRPTYPHHAYETYNHRTNYYQRYQHQEYKEPPKDYYGVSGLKKLPNYIIIMVCFGIALVGTLLQVLVIREMYISNRRKSAEQSKYLSEELEKVRATAKSNTNDIHTKILLEKIVQSANPTIATASLGQALANEKKDQENILTEFGLSDISDPWLTEFAEQTLDQEQS